MSSDEEFSRTKESTHDMDSEKKELLPAEGQPPSRSSSKPEAVEEKNGLKREINTTSGVGLVVSQMIGSALFIAPRTILCEAGSFGLTMTLWVVGAVVTLLAAMCYIELGLLICKSGGEYAYLLEAYSFRNRNKWTTFTGSLIAFLFSWVSIFFIRPGIVAVYILAFAKYLVNPLFVDCEVPNHVVTLVALSAILVLAIINSYSVKLVARFSTLLAVLKILACVFVIVVAILYVAIFKTVPENLQHPFQPIDNNVPSASSIAIALYSVLFAYDGWNVLNYAIEETKRPERTLPLSLLIGVPIVSICYILVNVSFFIVLPYDMITASDTVGLTFGKVTIGAIPGLITVSLMVAVITFGAANGGIFTSARIVYVTSRDGLFLEVFSGVQQSFKTPLPSIVLMAGITAVFVCVGSIEVLIQGVTAAMWFFYLLVFCSVLILRITHPKYARPFKAWVMVPIAVFMILVSVFLVVVPLVQQPIPSLAAFAVILVGVPVYVFLVMEQPCRLWPRIFDRVTEDTTSCINAVLNTESTRPHR